MFLSWIQGTNWENPGGGLWTVNEDYGFFHVYAFTMTMGVIFAIAISALKLYRRGISLNELWIAAAIIVPVGLLGASFFGKLNAQGLGENANGVSFFGLFAFWEGGMAIHGGVYSGTIAGVIIFYFLSKRTKVSLWVYADCIIPNVLVGQGIGRWGNFFNHELIGRPLAEWNNGQTDALKWLPEFIRTNMVFKYTGNNSIINGLPVEQSNLYVMSPIFLYESLSLIFAWVIITFIIPNIGKWIGKKPWKLNPDKFEPKFFNFKIWRTEVFANHEYKEIELYKKEFKKINDENFIKRKWKQGKLLSKCNNPQGYYLVRTGVQAGLYFFVWNMVRFILETGRPDDHLFLMYQRTLSLTVIGLSMFAGLIVSILSQWVIPYLFRKPGIIYEQEYFYLDESEWNSIQPIINNDESKEKKWHIFNLKEKKASSEKEKIKIDNKISKKKLKEQKVKEKLDKKLGKK
ncbi:prolipoprotein diacylglyceryl transferase [Spiroplasma monobiae]|uniref:Prolipoprotein diacylglyceryl transferase n=1 Tax=Spiroplasma monobiae MQ-1 TaxID=1336748 RepID=A0A2K9LTW3_SPISQ|nr:prolipoprotein diacylglyceryl transferase family protein [Spiroplasma monobiae]AUM62321.1 prolipoprotein diacylglyceryl transferase [Spiroplasma monobiae MQ-1]